MECYNMDCKYLYTCIFYLINKYTFDNSYNSTKKKSNETKKCLVKKSKNVITNSIRNIVVPLQPLLYRNKYN